MARPTGYDDDADPTERSSTPLWLEKALETGGATARLASQLRFVFELDKAKSVLRRTYVSDASRLEDDAGHMWHAAVAALVLAEHSDEPVDVSRLVTMLAIHDIVEIDAGDTFIYDDTAMSKKHERERVAADRLFGLLPDDQRAQLQSLWLEFEEGETATARMAAAIDRLLPILLNRAVDGRTWAEHGVGAEAIFERNSGIDLGSHFLWSVARSVLEHAEADGLIA